MEDNLQARYLKAKQAGEEALAENTIWQKHKLEQALMRKVFFTIISILSILFSLGLIVWRSFFVPTYSKCLDDCEIESLRNTDDRDCKSLCQKYLKK